MKPARFREGSIRLPGDAGGIFDHRDEAAPGRGMFTFPEDAAGPYPPLRPPVILRCFEVMRFGDVLDAGAAATSTPAPTSPTTPGWSGGRPAAGPGRAGRRGSSMLSIGWCRMSRWVETGRSSTATASPGPARGRPTRHAGTWATAWRRGGCSSGVGRAALAGRLGEPRAEPLVRPRAAVVAIAIRPRSDQAPSLNPRSPVPRVRWAERRGGVPCGWPPGATA